MMVMVRLSIYMYYNRPLITIIMAGITRIYDGDFKYLIVIPFAEITIKFWCLNTPIVMSWCDIFITEILSVMVLSCLGVTFSLLGFYQ